MTGRRTLLDNNPLKRMCTGPSKRYREHVVKRVWAMGQRPGQKDWNTKMANTPEGKVKRVVTKQLKELGAYYFFPMTGGYGKSGVPDIIACYNGLFFGIECKAGKNKPTTLQEKNLRDIKEAGGRSFVINEENMHAVLGVMKNATSK